jgi:UDP-N-acetylmuramoyl-tripeptide--D-alanyl-D-alanine ligase
MNNLWTSSDAAEATGGKAEGAWIAKSVSIDSRTVEPGDLFVALKGPNFDGHEFVGEALKKGAAAAVVSAAYLSSAAFAKSGRGSGNLLVVADSYNALLALAKAARARSGARIAAITGSVGKTGAKEALRHILGAQGETHASLASFNNHWGVPLSLARLPPQARYAVFEIGMNHPGEIQPLAELVRPHAALITTIEAVHLEFMKSIEAIADAKAEIFAGLDESGIAILNRDNSQYARVRPQAPGTVWSFGRDGAGEGILLEAVAGETGTEIRAAVLGQQVRYRLPVPGAHLALNSLGVLLVAAALGADLANAIASLSTLPAVPGRGTRTRIATADGTATLIDESYNASPIAMRAAIKVLGLAHPGAKGRRIAVLGDMLEMGSESPRFHRELAPDLIAERVDLVFLSGPNMKHLHDALAKNGGASESGGLQTTHAADSTSLAPLVAASIHDGDVVLVKGSLGSRMKVIVDMLTRAPAPKEAAHAV